MTDSDLYPYLMTSFVEPFAVQLIVRHDTQETRIRLYIMKNTTVGELLDEFFSARPFIPRRKSSHLSFEGVRLHETCTARMVGVVHPLLPI